MIETLSEVEVHDLLDRQVVGRLGCHHDGFTYVVPVIYARLDDAIVFYTTEGLKVELLRANPSVCFEIDEYDELGGWQSVIIQGTASEVSGDDAKAVLSALAERFARRRAERSTGEGQRPRAEGRAPVAVSIAIEALTGRKVAREAYTRA